MGEALASIAVILAFAAFVLCFLLSAGVGDPSKEYQDAARAVFSGVVAAFAFGLIVLPNAIFVVKFFWKSGI